MGQHQRVVITGFGLVTSLGSDPESTFEAVAAGECGIGPMSALEQRPNPDKGGGQAVDLPADFRPDLPRVSRYLRFAALQALQRAGSPTCPAERRSICLGTTLHGMPAGGRFIRSGNPSELRGFLAGAVLQQALDDLGFHGAMITNCSACASGLASVGLAASMLRGGAADMVLAGGYDCVSEYAYAGFDSLRLIAAGPPLPFAGCRDGMKVAEGYAVLVMEREESAVSRGAAILAHVAAIGETSDSFHLTQPQPDGSGAAKAIRAALDGAGLSAAQVDMVAAHATSTLNNDAAEYAALHQLFQDRLSEVPVTAFKSHLGHTLGAAGAVELILSALSLKHQTIPMVAHHRHVDRTFPALRLVQTRSLKRPLRTTLNLSLGFGGSNACALLQDRGSSGRRTSAPQQLAVITGVGVVVPGGIGNAAFLRRIGSGELPMGGRISDDALENLVNARRARRISGYSRLTLAATSAACLDAGVLNDPAYLASCSAMLGTTHGASPFCEAYYSQLVGEGINAANPVLFAEGVPNAAAAQMSLMLGLNGACQTFIGSRTAGLDAMRMAALRITLGEAERVLVSGAEEHSAIVEGAYPPCGILDRNSPEPWLTGSGAVTFVLESERSARERGARIRGTIEPGAASSGAAPGILVDGLISELAGPKHVISSLSQARPDRAAAAALTRHGVSHWTIRSFIPELFSAGPMAGLAAWLLGAGPRTEYAGILGLDFGNFATTLGVRRTQVPD